MSRAGLACPRLLTLQIILSLTSALAQAEIPSLADSRLLSGYRTAHRRWLAADGSENACEDHQRDTATGCVCEDEFFNSSNFFRKVDGEWLLKPFTSSEAGTECSSCPEGARCQGGEQLVPLRGYWRANNKSAQVTRCDRRDRCNGAQECASSDAVATEEGSCVDGWHFLSEDCSSGYRGPLCGICTESHVQ
eukprot:gene24727-30111_t